MTMANFSGYFTRMWRRILRLVYRFDKWHISSIDQRKYARDIITHANSRVKKEFYAEIGCGLGDIICNVDFTVRCGFDADHKVLKAAKFNAAIQNKQDIKFEEFHFPETPLHASFDVITLVNWIHHIDPLTLKTKIGEYFNNNLYPGGEIIIDTVQDREYKFNHQITSLSEDLTCTIQCIGKYSREREVWAIKK